MKWVRTAIGAVIAISVIPAIILTVINVTELKDVKNVQFELLSEEGDNFSITSGTYNKLIENKNIINYDIESNYTLITHEELERGKWRLNEELYNEIIDWETNPRIVENVGKVVLNGDEEWQRVNSNLFVIYNASQFNMILNTDDSNKIITDQEGFEVYTTTDLLLRTTSSFTNTNDLKQYLSQNPLTVTYELAVRNPKTINIPSNYIVRILSEYENLTTRFLIPIDKIIESFSDFNYDEDSLTDDTLNFNMITNYNIPHSLIQDIDEEGFYFRKDYGIWIRINKSRYENYEGRNEYEKFLNYIDENPLIITYELTQPRLAEQYDLSTFKLTFDDNRIRVLFDINDGYYLWEITNDDRLIPLNGQHELGNTWTVKFYVYEIQQPLIRSLVLLIPLIVISGLLYYLYIIVSKRE